VTEDALLQAVLADADDDAPRLIYADWLDEQGESDRAEFIRVQCALARLGADRYPTAAQSPSRVYALRRRERELLHSPAGTAFRPDCCYGCPCEITWRRGFVEAVTCRCADFRRYRDALLAACPLRQVTLTECVVNDILGRDVGEEQDADVGPVGLASERSGPLTVRLAPADGRTTGLPPADLSSLCRYRPGVLSVGALLDALPDLSACYVPRVTLAVGRGGALSLSRHVRVEVEGLPARRRPVRRGGSGPRPWRRD
jgi:uncharacterized protein (TIGR02996 family)